MFFSVLGGWDDCLVRMDLLHPTRLLGLKSFQVTAICGDVAILVFFLVQRRVVLERMEWTDDLKELAAQ